MSLDVNKAFREMWDRSGFGDDGFVSRKEALRLYKDAFVKGVEHHKAYTNRPIQCKRWALGVINNLTYPFTWDHVKGLKVIPLHKNWWGTLARMIVARGYICKDGVYYPPNRLGVN